MSLRKSPLAVTLFNLGGTSFLGTTKTYDFNIPVTDDDCRVAEDRYHTAVATKKKLEFSIERIPHVAGVCQSGLSVSAWSVGGNSYLGELNTGSISASTDVEDGSGVADLWEFPNAMGTGLEIQADHFVTSQASLFHLAGQNNITSIQVELVITLGGTSITAPFLMTAATHHIEAGQIQMQNVTFKLAGAPTSVTGDAMVIEIITGDAFIAWAVETGAGDYSGNGIITSTSINFSNGQLLSMEHTVANQGLPAIGES